MEETLNELTRAVAAQDMDTVKRILSEVVDNRDVALIKCEGCGEIVAFEPTVGLIATAFNMNDARIKYLVIDHMAKCSKHDVQIILGEGFKFPLSMMIERGLREIAAKNGVDYEADLPNIVERWRQKAQK